MKILITGASGFIGSHLVKKLANTSNTTVFVVLRNDMEFNSPSIIKIITDLSIEGFEDSFPEYVDCVIHLAQSESYREFPEKASQIFNVNVRATQRLLDWAHKNKIKKFIFSSTGNVFKQKNKLLSEEDECEPLGYYGASKFAAEQLIKSYQSYFDISILRIFGVYGPNQKNMTIPNIINRIKSNNEITLANNEGLWFTPLYIDDCVDMFLLLINSDKINNNKLNTYNIAGDEIIQLGQLVKDICQILDIEPRIKTVNSLPTYLMGDASLFKANYNYKLITNIKKGIFKILKDE